MYTPPLENASGFSEYKAAPFENPNAGKMKISPKLTQANKLARNS